MSVLARGYRFTHERMLDMGWKPGPGQKWSRDAPKARMVVTRVSGVSVWYGYDVPGARGAWVMDRAEFEARYVAK